MPKFKELRRRMIVALGSRCAECGDKFDPSDLIIHHKAFERGKTIGYNKRERFRVVHEWARTGKLPIDIELLCDDCNRKRHGYRPSKRRIFGDIVDEKSQ